MKEKDSSVSTRRNTKKILNNSYKNGDNLKTSEEYEFTRSLSVDMIDAEQYMNVSYDFDSILYQEMIDYVNLIIDSDENMSCMFTSCAFSPEDVNQKKFTKDEMNTVFYIIHGKMHEKYSRFFKLSYVFQIICNLLSVTHTSLFDALDYENKKSVLVGLSNELGMDITKTNYFV